MVLTVLVTLACLAAAQETDWPQRWDSWLEWRDRLGEADAERRAGWLAAIGEPDEPTSRAAALRRAILRAQIATRLESWPGEPPPVIEPGAEAARLAERVRATTSGDPPAGGELSAREWWLAAEVLPPSEERARVICAALDRSMGEPIDGPRIQLAYEAGVDAARAFRLDDALAMQERLHRHRKKAWSAMNYAQTLQLLGRYDEADAVLREEIEGGEGRELPELWNRRALVSLGRADLESALDRLGRAYHLGSANAAVSLARLHLERDSNAAARAILRAEMGGEDPSAWARRMWGIALLAPRGSDEAAGR